MRPILTVLAGALAMLAADTADAQRGRGRGRERGGIQAGAEYDRYVQGGDPADIRNFPYDGRFTFARIRYEPTLGQGGMFTFRGRDMKWDHDVPRGELNFVRILSELTLVRPNLGGGNYFTADDPELMKYPVAYLCEAGFWSPTDREAEGLRKYLAKGGFLIFDDFGGPYAWEVFQRAMLRVLPGAQVVPLDASHPIFDSFFRVENPQGIESYYGVPTYYGIYEDNNPKKRLLAIVNYNNDLSELWEFSGSGFYAVNLSNEAYKLGVNYVVYGMTR